MMNNKFTHILITRFNLRNKNWSEFTKNKTKTLTPQWHEDRFKLFEKYCLPSVQNQANKNFTWWIFFDHTTPEVYREKALNLENKCAQIKVQFIDGMDEFLPYIQKKLATLSTPYIITSRLDNDDAIHQDYIDFIQAQFRHQSFEAVDIAYGYNLSISPNLYFGTVVYPFNPFLSLIEKNQNPKSVFVNDHNQWKKSKSLKRIKGKMLWLTILHDSNKVNAYTGYGFPKVEKVLPKFGLSTDETNQIKVKNHYPSLLRNFWNFLRAYSSVYYKDAKRYIRLKFTK